MGLRISLKVYDAVLWKLTWSGLQSYLTGKWLGSRVANLPVVAVDLLGLRLISGWQRTLHLRKITTLNYTPLKFLPFPNFVFLRLYPPNFQIFPNLELGTLCGNHIKRGVNILKLISILHIWVRQRVQDFAQSNSVNFKLKKDFTQLLENKKNYLSLLEMLSCYG